MASAKKPAKKTEEEIERRQIISLLWEPGQWFRMPRHLCAVLSIYEAYMLSYLIGVSTSIRTEERSDGWFYHTTNQIQERIHLSPKTQKRVFRSLKEKKLIETKRKGLPAKRFIRVNLIRTLELIREGGRAESDKLMRMSDVAIQMYNGLLP